MQQYGDVIIDGDVIVIDKCHPRGNITFPHWLCNVLFINILFVPMNTLSMYRLSDRRRIPYHEICIIRCEYKRNDDGIFEKIKLSGIKKYFDEIAMLLEITDIAFKAYICP